MAIHTAPAAIPDPPSEPPATGIPNLPGGPRTSLFAAVDPARPDDGSTFHLTPTTGESDDTLLMDPAGSPSSDAFHNNPNDPTDGTNSGNSGKQETRIWRAWLLAGAERWRKGADARNKALDIRKAQASAFKESRTTTVNRTEKNVGGSTSTGSNTSAGKSSSNKTSPGGGANGAGRGGSSGSGRSGGTSGGSGGGAGRGSAGGHRKDTKGTQSGGSGSGGKGSWKDKATHGSAGGGGKDTKNGPAGGGGKGGGKGSNVEHKTARETPPKRSPRTGKTDKDPASPKRGKNDTPNTKTDKTTASGNSGSSGGSGGAGKKNSGSGKTPTPQQKTATCGDASGIDLTKNKTPKTAKDTGGKPGNTPGPKGAPGGSGGTAGANTGAGKTPPPAPGGGTKPVDLGKKNPDTKGGDKAAAKADPKAAPKTGQPVPAPASGGPAIDTKSSRETGYRDGTRIGKAEAHVRAYTHGVRDGRTDMREAADRDKQRLDKAHDDRKKQQPAPAPAPPAVPPKPTVPPKPAGPPQAQQPATPQQPTKKVPPMPPTPPRQRPNADGDLHDIRPRQPRRDKPNAPRQRANADGDLLHLDPRHPRGQQVPPNPNDPTTATPIQVKNADATHLELGDGADRQFISRGEVRNLSGQQHNLTGRKGNLTKIAERAKVYQAHAQQQTKDITKYLEQARSTKVKGGEKVVAELAKLEEASKVQEAKAREVVKRAERSADACVAVSANLEVRYGDIYRAAADSADEPAEFNYYRDLGYANV